MVRRRSLSAELRHLERTDPDVRAAARRYDEMRAKLTTRPLTDEERLRSAMWWLARGLRPGRDRADPHHEEELTMTTDTARFIVMHVPSAPIHARVTFASNKHGSIEKMANSLNAGTLDPRNLEWIPRPIGRDLAGMAGVLCVVDRGEG